MFNAIAHADKFNYTINRTGDAIFMAGIPFGFIDSPHLPGIYTAMGIIWMASKAVIFLATNPIPKRLWDWLCSLLK